jgi:hypothetical protein
MHRSTWVNLHTFYCYENQIESFPENFGSYKIKNKFIFYFNK